MATPDGIQDIYKLLSQVAVKQGAKLQMDEATFRKRFSEDEGFRAYVQTKVSDTYKSVSELEEYAGLKKKSTDQERYDAVYGGGESQSLSNGDKEAEKQVAKKFVESTIAKPNNTAKVQKGTEQDTTDTPSDSNNTTKEADKGNNEGIKEWTDKVIASENQKAKDEQAWQKEQSSKLGFAKDFAQLRSASVPQKKDYLQARQQERNDTYLDEKDIEGLNMYRQQIKTLDNEIKNIESGPGGYKNPDMLLGFKRQQLASAKQEADRLETKAKLANDKDYATFYDSTTYQPVPIERSVEALDKYRNEIITELGYSNSPMSREFQGKTYADLTPDQKRVVDSQFASKYMDSMSMQTSLANNNYDLDLKAAPHSVAKFGKGILGVVDLLVKAANSTDYADPMVMQNLYDSAKNGLITKAEFERRYADLNNYYQEKSENGIIGFKSPIKGLTTIQQKTEPDTSYGSKVVAYSSDQISRWLSRMPSFEQIIEGAESPYIVPEQQSFAGKLADKLKTNPVYNDSFWLSKVPEALGSSVLFAGISALSGGAGLITASAAGALMQAQGQFEDAVRSGATPDAAIKAFTGGAIVGSSEGIQIERMLTRMKGVAGWDAVNAVIRSGSEEAIQETFQKFGEEELARFLYDETRGLQNVTAENPMIGFVSGVLMAGFTNLASRDKSKLKYEDAKKVEEAYAKFRGIMDGVVSEQKDAGQESGTGKKGDEVADKTGELETSEVIDAGVGQSNIKTAEDKQGVEEIAEVEEGSGGDMKQKELEAKVDNIKEQRKALRGEDGSVPDNKLAEFNRLGKELAEANNKAKRGNSLSSILIKKIDKNSPNPIHISKEEKSEAADLIEQVIQGSKTIEQVIDKVRKLGYVFDFANADLFARYLNDRFSDAPQVGNNKSSFQDWVNGKQPTQEVKDNTKPTISKEQTHSEVKKQVHSDFNNETGLDTVLVGSVSRGEAKEGSDIDIVLEGMPHVGKEKLNEQERVENSNYAYDTLRHLAEKGVITEFELKANGFGLNFKYKGQEFQVVPNPSTKPKDNNKPTISKEQQPTDVSKEEGSGVKIKYGGAYKDLKGNPQRQWMKPKETSEQATDRLAEFVESSDYKGREQSTYIDKNGKSEEVKLRNDDGKWNWYYEKSKKPFASFGNAKDAIKFIQEQPFWDNGELNKAGRNDAYFAKVKTDHIKTELENGNILEDINDGKISAKDAAKIIESAGLEVPKDIAEQSLKETTKAGSVGVVGDVKSEFTDVGYVAARKKADGILENKKEATPVVGIRNAGSGSGIFVPFRIVKDEWIDSETTKREEGETFIYDDVNDKYYNVKDFSKSELDFLTDRDNFSEQSLKQQPVSESKSKVADEKVETPAKKEEKPFTPKTKITAEELGVEDKNIDDIDRKIEEGKKRLSEAKARRDEVKKQEMPSLSEIKSDVIEKIPEAVRAVKKTKGTNAEKDKKLKIQKADLVGQLEEAIAVINEPLTGIEHADKLEEQGFEVIRNNVGDVESVVFEIEDDGVFKLDARGLEDAKKQVEKLWPTSTAFKTPSTVRNYQAKQKAGDYSTKAKAEANKQAALDNLELAKSEGDAKRIELFQKQAEIESEAYKEAVEIAESRDMEIKRIEESEIEDIYDIDQKLELPQLKADKAKWEGKEIKEEKPDYEKLKEALDRLEKNEQKEFDEYTEPLRRKDGEIKASINKEQQRRVDNFAFTLNEIKEKRKALEELSPKKKSIDSKIADKKAELKERKENRGKLGILNNQSENEAEILAIYTDLAGLYIAKGLKSALEFAKELGEDLSDLIQTAWDNANKNAEDTLPESEGTTPKEEDSPRERKKALSNRAFEGDNTQELKDAIEKHGLTYKVESWEAAKADAKAFIDEVGIEGGLEAVRRGLVKGAPAAFIWAETIDTVHNKIAESTSPKEIEQLTKYEAELLEEFNNQSKIAGRFISALQEVYAMSDVNYNVEYQIEKYKKANKGFIAPEVEAKMREMAKQLEDVKERLREAEQREKDITEEINNIKESVERERGGETKSPQEIEQLVAQGVETEIKKIHAKLPTARRQKAEKAAKVLTDFQKRLRSKAYDATIGIPVAIIDGGITVIKNAILAGAKVADAIEIGINNIRGKWGKEWKEDEFRKDIRDAFETEGINVSSKADKPIKQDDGSIKIPHDLIRDLVERGLTDPNELTKAVLDIVRQEIPEATERQVRDAISNYGKVVNLSQEEIEIEIRKIKRAQRIMSALEDIAQKKRPLRSGLQRDVLGTEERALQKQLKEAMKTLPVDLELEAKNLKTSLDAIERRLLNQIADLQREIDLGEKSVKEKKELPYTDRIKELMAERDAMKAMHEEVFGKPEVTDEQRIERAIKATERATAAINKRIADNELETKRRTPVSNAALEVAKAELRAAKERLLGLQELAGIPEKKRLEQAKNAAKRKILELQDRIARKDYSRRKRTPLAEDSELAQLRAEKQTIKDEFDKLQYANELKNRSLTEKIIDGIIEAWGITRALRATAEFSFILIQGGFFVVSHPIIAAKGIATAFSHFASQKRSDDFAKRIKSQTWYNGVKEDKLAITETDYKLNAREELFLNGWVNHIWDILGLPAKLAGEKAYENWKKLNPVKAFERANVGALNTIRLARYFDGVRLLELQGKTRLSHPQDYKNIADLVNTFTGRASIGGVDQSKAMSKVLPMIFFSPKMWASTLKTFTPYSFYHFGKMTSAELGNRGNLGKDNKTGKIQVSAAQKMAMADYMKFVGATGAVVAAFAMKYNNDDDEETSVSFDPNSSDFLKIKIGNTRIDPWGGRIQMIVLQSRLLSNSMTSTSTGKNLPLGVPYKTPTGFGLMGQMTRNKLAPSASLLVKYLDRYENKKGERVDKYGKEVAMSDEVINNLYPIYWETINELHAEQPETVALFLDFYGFLGGGVQTYESKKKK